MNSLYHRLDNSPRGQIIKLIQRHGPLGIKDFRLELGLSDTAVRQQLRTLMAEGLVQTSQSDRSGPGRPSQRYELTVNARSLFACHSEDLALNLYNELLSDQGPDLVDALLARVGEKLAGQYQHQVKGRILDERVRSFAAVLDSKGIMSDVTRQAEVIVLHEYNCPYHEIAASHREICEMEQDMMSKVLDADVELTLCMMDGHSNCSFAVKTKSPSDAF